MRSFSKSGTTAMSLIVLTAAAIVSQQAVQALYNPVIYNENVPDPGALVWNGLTYVVSTAGSHEGKFPIHRSSDLQNWQIMGYALPRDKSPSWAQSPDTDFWAPELHTFNDKFYLYFTLRDHEGVLCIGVATSDNILGPFEDSGKPLIKQQGMGSIDATVMHVDANTRYLVWKDDGNGNRPQQPTIIWAQKLTDDGLNVVGARQELIRNDLPWEGDVTEGPWIIQENGWYYLFYSGHGYCDASYSVGVARSRNPLGPYEKHGDPILFTHGKWVGPGHCSVVKTIDNSSWAMIYHSWENGKVCGNNNREMLVDYIDWVNEWPVVRTSSLNFYQSSYSNEFLKTTNQ
eukprot:403356894